MPDGTAAPASPARDLPGTVRNALRFLLTDRVGLLILVWALVAFLVRPMLLAAHHGAPAALLAGLAADPVGLSRLVGMIQWLSMILPVLALAIIHLRLPPLADPVAAARRAFLLPAGYAVILAGGYLAFVWTPTTYLSLITGDSFIFFDAIYRIGEGQHPHIDFPTALGAATLYLPWLGSVFAGGSAGAIELISVPLALLLGLVCAHAGLRRFPAGVTASLAALIFLVAVPAVLLGLNYTDSHTFMGKEAVVLSDNSTYAMFYNRWGWAVMIALFCYLAPRQAPAGEDDLVRDRARLIETVVLAVLLAFLFYLKITYFLVGCVAAALYAFTNERPLRTLAVGAGASLGLVLAFGFGSGLLLPYLRDLAFVAQINAGKTDTLLTILRGNAPGILLALAPLGLLGALGRLTWKDGAVGGFLVLASIFLVVQNAQLFDMLTLVCLAAYGFARVVSFDNRLARLAAAGAFGLTILAPLVDRTFGLIQQTSGSRREEVRAPAPWDDIPALRNVFIAEREDVFADLTAAPDAKAMIDIWNFSNRLGSKEITRQGAYMTSLLAGMADLRGVMRPGESVVTVEMSNPFPFLMGVRAAKGSYLTLDGERTFSINVHPDPEQMFADADHVMIPRLASRTADMAHRIYDDWLDRHYAERVETLYWVRWSRRRPAIRGATQASLIP